MHPRLMGQQLVTVFHLTGGMRGRCAVLSLSGGGAWPHNQEPKDRYHQRHHKLVILFSPMNKSPKFA
jgi:hypothetical protein